MAMAHIFEYNVSSNSLKMGPTSSVFLTNNSPAMHQNDTQDPPDYIRMISNIFFPTILVIGVVGNLMVISVIIKMRDMRSSTNILLANLAVSDLMVLFVWGTEQLIDNNLERGIMAYSEKVCNLVFICMETVYDASVLTILNIGFERYIAICKPLEAKKICTRYRAYRFCLLIWPIAFLFSTPHLFIKYHTKQYTQKLHAVLLIKTICVKPPDSLWTDIFYITSTTLFYVIPLIILLLFYLAISRRFKKPVTQNDNTFASKHRQRVVAMVATVIVAFFVGHLPIRVAYLTYFFATGEIMRRFGVVGFKAMRLFAVSMLYFDSILNPILYNIMSRRFRAGFRSLLGGMACRKNTYAVKVANTATTEISTSWD